ncbi:UNVERIFIED_CONTAM: hypothetical protein RMT77_012905 [Armadillidium vulgare]
MKTRESLGRTGTTPPDEGINQHVRSSLCESREGDLLANEVITDDSNNGDIIPNAETPPTHRDLFSQNGR